MESSYRYSDDSAVLAEAPLVPTTASPKPRNPTKPVCIGVTSTVNKSLRVVRSAIPRKNAWRVPDTALSGGSMSSAPAASSTAAAPVVAEPPPAAELAGVLPASSPPSAAVQM